MAQDFDLFVGLAEIAGVFVGFAALISFTRRSEMKTPQLVQIRAVVSIGLMVIVAALFPIALGHYGITGHKLWLVSSLVFLALLWFAMIFGFRKPEYREVMATQMRTTPVASAFFWVVLELPIQVPLFLTVFGPFPDLEPAFYTTGLILHLFEGAFVLTQLVYAQISADD